MKPSEQIIRARYKIASEKVLEALESKNYEAYFCETKEEAKEKVLSLIPEGNSVAWGGSFSLEEAGVIDAVKKGDFKVIDRDMAKTPQERQEMMKKTLTCDTYLASVNAMAEDGTMINIDGNGNRIAAIAYGPNSVILLVGMNKLCKTREDAITRARTVAAPTNSIRLGMENLPCVKTGVCCNCNSPDCICSQIVEMRRNRVKGRIKVVLVGECLGF